jgi:Amt family ammonium transporter
MRLVAVFVLSLAASNLFAQTPPALEQRVAALEAYLANADPQTAQRTAGPGHNAWMMVSAALVLFMTLPGLALFYGGLVRRKNVLSILAQCLGITGLVTLLWRLVGFSFVFARGSPFLGGFHHAFLHDVTGAPNPDYAFWVSGSVFAMYELMFAIITPALIIGAVAERMKFSAIILFVTLWMFVVYFPLAHMIWGIDGWMNGVWNSAARIKAVDFAGGTVVHMSSGWSALILCLILGPRRGWGRENMPPHNLVLCMVGTGMLWVGWYGFNAGSALAADGLAANAFMTTTLAAAVASSTWGAAEWITRGRATVLGFCSGIVAGLVVITPAAGFVDATSAVLIGTIAGIIPFLAVAKLKSWLHYDDALDTFGIHAVGGTIGALLTGVFASARVNPNLSANVFAAGAGPLWLEQLKAMGVTVLIAALGTIAIGLIVRAAVGLRLSPEAEEQGLDINEHGEEGYILER